MTPAPSIAYTLQPRVDLIFFSAVRWDLDVLRIHRLATGWAATHRVWFCEEPLYDSCQSFFEVERRGRVRVVVPHLGPEVDPVAVVGELVRELAEMAHVVDPVAWFSDPTPLADAVEDLPFAATVWDCPEDRRGPGTSRWEARMLDRADLVLTSTPKRLERERRRHPNVHLLPDLETEWDESLDPIRALVSRSARPPLVLSR